jgi:hypothetical protein
MLLFCWGETIMEPMQSSFGHTFSGIFPLGTLAGLEGMLSSHTEPSCKIK